MPHLAPDLDGAAQPVDVVGGEAEDLALAQPETGAELERDPVAVGERLPHGSDPLDGPRHDLRRLPSWRGHRLPALHGFLAIRSSSTAADRIVETVPSATLRVLAAPDEAREPRLDRATA